MIDKIYKTVDLKHLMASTKKSARRQIQIAEVGIDLLYAEGLENFSYDKLSKKCGIARSLIYHYYPSLVDLMIFIGGYIRYQYQMMVIREMQKETAIDKMLSSYIRSALGWVDIEPKHAAVWVTYFTRCAISDKLAKYNTELVDIGTERIETLLKEGVKEGFFKIKKDNIPDTARIIQILITGQFISMISEKRSKLEWDIELDRTVAFCMKMVQ